MGPRRRTLSGAHNPYKFLLGQWSRCPTFAARERDHLDRIGFQNLTVGYEPSAEGGPSSTTSTQRRLSVVLRIRSERGGHDVSGEIGGGEGS